VLFQTLGQLSVRNEFCQEIMDHGGLHLILNALANNMDHQVSSTLSHLQLTLNALANSMDHQF